MRTLATTLCLLLLVSSQQLQAQAASGASSASEYGTAVAQGLAEFDRQKYAAARVHFARAHQLKPSARTLRVLGLADFSLDDFSAAREELAAALAGRIEPLTDAQRPQLEELLLWMATNLGEVRLEFQPAGTQVTIDERATERSELLLPPGAHRLRARAPGYLPLERTFTVKLGAEPTRVREELMATQPQELRPPALAKRDRSQLWLWLGSGGVACAAGGGVLFGIGLHQSSKVESTTGFVSADRIESRARQADWLIGVGIGVGVAGVAGMAAALYSLVNEERAEPSQTAWFYGVGPGAMSVGKRF
jgi:hypothetical protein